MWRWYDSALVMDLTLETRITFISLSLVYSNHPEDHSYVAKSPWYFIAKQMTGEAPPSLVKAALIVSYSGYYRDLLKSLLWVFLNISNPNQSQEVSLKQKGKLSLNLCHMPIPVIIAVTIEYVFQERKHTLARSYNFPSLVSSK